MVRFYLPKIKNILLIFYLFFEAARNDFTASALNVINVSFMAALNIIHFCRNPVIG